MWLCKHRSKSLGKSVASLTVWKTLLKDSIVDAISILEFRQGELPRLNQKFNDIQTQLALIEFDDFEKEEEERNKFEIDYFNIRSNIQEIAYARNQQQLSQLNL